MPETPPALAAVRRTWSVWTADLDRDAPSGKVREARSARERLRAADSAVRRQRGMSSSSGSSGGVAGDEGGFGGIGAYDMEHDDSLLGPLAGASGSMERPWARGGGQSRGACRPCCGTSPEDACGGTRASFAGGLGLDPCGARLCAYYCCCWWCCFGCERARAPRVQGAAPVNNGVGNNSRGQLQGRETGLGPGVGGDGRPAELLRATSLTTRLLRRELSGADGVELPREAEERCCGIGRACRPCASDEGGPDHLVLLGGVTAGSAHMIRAASVRGGLGLDSSGGATPLVAAVPSPLIGAFSPSMGSMSGASALAGGRGGRGGGVSRLELPLNRQLL